MSDSLRIDAGLIRLLINDDEDRVHLEAEQVPNNFTKTIALATEICNYLREQIDKVFGEDTSQMVFGDVQSLYMFAQFIDGITPYIQEVRVEKISPYLDKKGSKVME